MPVKRISEINISKRGLFTAIYGNVNEDEFFVDDDLKKYSLWSQLYSYLKEEGYEIVLFYDTTNNFHSYSQSDLIKFLNLNINQDSTNGIIQKEKYVAPHINSPFRQHRLNAAATRQIPPVDENPVHQSIQLVTEYGSSNNYYRTTINSNDILLTFFKKFLANTNRKVVVVIKYPDNSSFDFVDQYLTLFRELNSNYKKDESENKILIVYGCSNSESLIENLNRHSNYLFVNDYFKSIFLSAEADSYRVKPETTFQTSLPDQTEIRNWLNRKRLKNGVHLFNSVPLDKITLRFIQERKRLTDFENYDIPKFIGDISTKSGWDKLNEMIGLDSVKAKVKDVVEDLKFKREQQMEFTFRPHLCFMGNPGTGKTTVASIVAEIFKEEGIVPLGHYTSTKATELIGQYIGEAARLVKKKCEEATGGILFIDEAYAFIEEGTKVYGDSAVTELIAWLEDKKWQKETIVILAGYPDEINDLFKKSNKGLRGRFTDDHFLTFENYNAKELLRIFELNSKKNRISISTEAAALLEIIFAKLLQSNKDSKHWDNARRVENLFKLVFSNLRKRKTTLIEVQDIPENLTSIISGRSVSDIRQTNEYMELNKLIGLQNVKQTINDLIESIEFEQYQIENGMQVEKSIQPLHLVFSGPPGTGKTTVARLFGGLLKNLGVLTSGHTHEVNRQDLVAGYVGQTAIKTKEAIDKAMGGVLFIDEAYTLANGGENDFGREAIDTLLPIMENDREKFVVIVAGYESNMSQFLLSNPGLNDRFNQRILFHSNTEEELIEVFNLFCLGKNLRSSEDYKCVLIQYFSLLKRIDGERFSNSRAVRKLFDENVKQQKKRLNTERRTRELTREDMLLLTHSDIKEAVAVLNPTILRQIDFNCSSDTISNIPSETIQNESEMEVNNIVRNPISISIDRDSYNSNPINSVGLLKTKDAGGTAFIISKDGFLVTANHVVKNSDPATFFYNTDKVDYETELVWASKEIDIAILKIVSEKQDFIPIDISLKNEDPKIKEEVALIGYPRGGQLSADPYYSESIISNFSKKFKVNEQIFFDAIATYTNATGGYSGGPLIRKSDNKVIGVLHGGLPNEGNINYASDIRQILNAADITFIYNQTNIIQKNNPAPLEQITTSNSATDSKKANSDLHNFGITDGKLQEAIRYILYDYCVIDTNIWMETKKTKVYQGRIATLKNLYTKEQRQLVAHGSTYEELKKFADSEIRNQKSSAAYGALKMMKQFHKEKAILIPGLKSTHDAIAYADKDIYDFANEEYQKGKSILFITNDNDCNIRVTSSLSGLKSKNPSLPSFDVLDMEQISQSVDLIYEKLFKTQRYYNKK